MVFEDGRAFFLDAHVEYGVAVFAADSFQLGADDEVDQLDLLFDFAF